MNTENDWKQLKLEQSNELRLLQSTMNHLQFELTMSNEQIPAFIRLVARKALNDLRNGGGTTHVEPFIFWQLVRHSEATAVKSGLYTFVRVVNDENYVDIQTLNS
jgi:hypothetical protein